MLLRVTTEMASGVRRPKSEAHTLLQMGQHGPLAWGRCRVRMSAHPTVIRRLVELRHVGVDSYMSEFNQAADDRLSTLQMLRHVVLSARVSS